MCMQVSTLLLLFVVCPSCIAVECTSLGQSCTELGECCPRTISFPGFSTTYSYEYRCLGVDGQKTCTSWVQWVCAAQLVCKSMLHIRVASSVFVSNKFFRVYAAQQALRWL